MARCILAVALLVAACSSTAPDVTEAPLASGLVAIPTQAPPESLPSPQACPGGLALGTLVSDPVWGVALRNPAGVVVKVLWSYGWAARRDGDRLELLDMTGRVVANVGDHVELGGGFLPSGDFITCGGLEITDTPASSIASGPPTPTAISASSPGPSTPAASLVRPGPSAVSSRWNEALCLANPQPSFADRGAELQILRRQCQAAAVTVASNLPTAEAVTAAEWLLPVDNYMYPSQGDLWLYGAAGTTGSFVVLLDSRGGCCAVSAPFDPHDADRVVFHWGEMPGVAFDLIGRLGGSANLEGGCAWLTDSFGERWIVSWPDGYEVEFEGGQPVVRAEGGAVAAEAGNRIALAGVRDPTDVGSFCMVGRVFVASAILDIQDW